MVQEGGSGASWRLPASRPAGLRVRSCSCALGGNKPLGSWSTWCWALSSTQQKAIPSVQDTGTELQAGGSHDTVDFVSRFGGGSQHVWPLQVGGCSLCAVWGHGSMNGGINWERGCSTGSGKLLAACLCPFHSIKARALHGIKAYGTNKADLRRWSPGGKSV